MFRGGKETGKTPVVRGDGLRRRRRHQEDLGDRIEDVSRR
jgi:hypothetical protein